MAAELITIDAARARVLGAAAPLPAERVAIGAALGRVVRTDVVARGDAPPFACSAMDGYAVQAGPAGRRLAVAGESRAGAPAATAVGPGEAFRISTGAVLPAGATAVVRQEDAERRDGHILTLADAPAGAHIRGAGEDMRAGTLVLTAGTRLGPAELGAAVAAGAGELDVTRRPTVRVLCTGDELREPGQPLAPGQIHNSNGPMLAALAQRAGAQVGAPERLPDDRAATVEALRAALSADVVLVAGGVSVGPHDHVKPALAALGVSERFWGVALQPGKPTWFGTRGSSLVFGLPGNPVSAYVTFVLFAAPGLAALQAERAHPVAVPEVAALGAPVRRNPHREQALRVRLQQRGTELVAVPNGPQGSHIVTSLLGAQALAIVPSGDGELAPGTPVRLVPLPG